MNKIKNTLMAIMALFLSMIFSPTFAETYGAFEYGKYFNTSGVNSTHWYWVPAYDPVIKVYKITGTGANRKAEFQPGGMNTQFDSGFTYVVRFLFNKGYAVPIMYDGSPNYQPQAAFNVKAYISGKWITQLQPTPTGPWGGITGGKYKTFGQDYKVGIINGYLYAAMVTKYETEARSLTYEQIEAGFESILSIERILILVKSNSKGILV